MAPSFLPILHEVNSSLKPVLGSLMQTVLSVYCRKQYWVIKLACIFTWDTLWLCNLALSIWNVQNYWTAQVPATWPLLHLLHTLCRDPWLLPVNKSSWYSRVGHNLTLCKAKCICSQDFSSSKLPGCRMSLNKWAFVDMMFRTKCMSIM